MRGHKTGRYGSCRCSHAGAVKETGTWGCPKAPFRCTAWHNKLRGTRYSKPLHDTMLWHLKMQHCACPYVSPWVLQVRGLPSLFPVTTEGHSAKCSGTGQQPSAFASVRAGAQPGRGAGLNGLADQRARLRCAGSASRARTGAEHLSGKQKATQAEQKRGLFSLKFFFSRSRQRSSRSCIQTLRPYGVRAVREMPNAVTRKQKRGERRRKKSRYGKCGMCGWVILCRRAAEGALVREQGEGGEKDRVVMLSREGDRRW